MAGGRCLLMADASTFETVGWLSHTCACSKDGNEDSRLVRFDPLDLIAIRAAVRARIPPRGIAHPTALDSTMTTTITAVFPRETHAIQAVRSLLVAGFAEASIEVIRDDTPDRHRLVGWETSDWLRGALLGGAIGALGMMFSALAMTGPLAAIDMDTAPALLDFGRFGAVFGALVGLLVGSGT